MGRAVLEASAKFEVEVAEDSLDPPLTVGTVRQVPRVGNTDDRQTAAARQHWTGLEPLKHRLSSLLSDLPYTTKGALQHRYYLLPQKVLFNIYH